MLLAELSHSATAYLMTELVLTHSSISPKLTIVKVPDGCYHYYYCASPWSSSAIKLFFGMPRRSMLSNMAKTKLKVSFIDM